MSLIVLTHHATKNSKELMVLTQKLNSMCHHCVITTCLWGDFSCGTWLGKLHARWREVMETNRIYKLCCQCDGAENNWFIVLYFFRIEIFCSSTDHILALESGYTMMSQQLYRKLIYVGHLHKDMEKTSTTRTSKGGTSMSTSGRKEMVKLLPWIKGIDDMVL